MKYDHIGIPTKTKQEGMIHHPGFKVWVSDYEKSIYRIEWIFFEEKSPFHRLIQTNPHVCFIVKSSFEIKFQNYFGMVTIACILQWLYTSELKNWEFGEVGA